MNALNNEMMMTMDTANNINTILVSFILVSHKEVKHAKYEEKEKTQEAELVTHLQKFMEEK